MIFKKKQIQFLVAIVITYIALLSNSGGKTGVSAAGCGGNGCHGTNASTKTKLRLDMSPPFSSTLIDIDSAEYEPGDQYHFLYYIQNNDYIGITNSKIGFSAKYTKGTLIKTDNSTAVQGNEVYHISPRSVSGNAFGNFNFEWVAPAVGSGDVIVTIAGNMVSGSGTPDGDAWNIKTIKLKEKPNNFPAISSVTSSNTSNNSTKISASINPKNKSTTVEVEYGLTTSYGSTKSTTPSQVSGTTNTNVQAIISGLTANTTYQYRIKAVNSDGTTYSENFTFKTTGSGSSISSSTNYTIELYPNPAKNLIAIDVNNLSRIQKVFIINTQGQKTELKILSNLDNKIIASIEGISKGKYFIQLQSEKESSEIKSLIVD